MSKTNNINANTIDSIMFHSIMALLLLIIVLLFSKTNLAPTKDDGAWESCRAKHSKQVCINILQEVGEE